MTDITSSTITPSGAVVSITAGSLAINTDLLRVLGFIGDGNSHPLSSVQPSYTLAQWQVIFPPNSTTGSAGARALSDEIDGLAIQRVLDLGVAAGLGAVVQLPVCNARSTYAFVTNGTLPVGIIGSGVAGATVSFVGSNTDGWSHGQTTAGGTLSLQNVTFLADYTSGVAVRVASQVSPSLVMDHVHLTNFIGGCIVGKNITGSRFYDVDMLNGNGVSGTPGSFDAVILTESQGSFQNLWSDCQISGYNHAFSISETTNAGYEGQFWFRCQINQCNHCLSVTSTESSSYSAPQFSFENCEWECYNSWFNITGISDFTVRDGFGLSLGGVGGFNYVNINAVQVFRWENNDVIGFNSPSYFLYMKSVVGAKVRENSFSYNGAGTVTGGIYIDSGVGSLVEEQNEFPIWPTSPAPPKIAGVTLGSICRTLSALAGGLYTEGGNLVFAGSTAGSTDANGQIAISFPTRPDGSAFYSSVYTIIVSNGDSLNGPNDVVGVVIASTTMTNFKVQWSLASSGAPIPSGQPRRTNWIAYGGG